MTYLHLVALSLSYAYIGGAIKLLDDILDRDWAFSGRTPICWALTISTVLLSGIWITIDTYSAILALSLIISLVLVWKIDNRYFITISLATLLVAFIIGFQWLLLVPSFVTLIILIPTFVVDELLHGLAEVINYRIPRWLLLRRPLAKIMVTVLSYFYLFTLAHALAFWSFDITYDIVAFLGARIFPSKTSTPNSDEGL
jgi:hypothetical protein